MKIVKNFNIRRVKYIFSWPINAYSDNKIRIS